MVGNYWLERRKQKIHLEFMFDGVASQVEVDSTIGYPNTLRMGFYSAYMYTYLENFCLYTNPWLTYRPGMLKVVYMPDTEVESWHLENIQITKPSWSLWSSSVWSTLYISCTNGQAITSRYFSF